MTWPLENPAADGRIWMNIPYMGYMMISVYNCMYIYIYMYIERERKYRCVYITPEIHIKVLPLLNFHTSRTTFRTVFSDPEGR